MSETQRSETEAIDVAYVAHLARLHLGPEETERLQAQLEQIVGYVRKIGEVDLSGVEPMAHAARVENVFRADEVRPGLSRDEALDNAPAAVDGLFQVPKIVE